MSYEDDIVKLKNGGVVALEKSDAPEFALKGFGRRYLFSHMMITGDEMLQHEKQCQKENFIQWLARKVREDKVDWLLSVGYFGRCFR